MIRFLNFGHCLTQDRCWLLTAFPKINKSQNYKQVLILIQNNISGLIHQPHSRVTDPCFRRYKTWKHALSCSCYTTPSFQVTKVFIYFLRLSSKFSASLFSYFPKKNTIIAVRHIAGTPSCPAKLSRWNYAASIILITPPLYLANLSYDISVVRILKTHLKILKTNTLERGQLHISTPNSFTKNEKFFQLETEIIMKFIILIFFIITLLIQ